MQSNVYPSFYNNFFRSRLNFKLVLKAERRLFCITVSGSEILYQNFIFNLIEKPMAEEKKLFFSVASRLPQE